MSFWAVFVKRGKGKKALLALIFTYLATSVILRFEGQRNTGLRKYTIYELVNYSSAQPTFINKVASLFQVEERPLLAPSLSEDEVMAMIESQISNLPFKAWQRHKNKKCSGKACVKYPSIYELRYNNIHWQTLRTSNGTFHLYNAFYDNRTLVEEKPVIRILGMVDRLQPPETYCQLWIDGFETAIISPVTNYAYIWEGSWGNHRENVMQPYLITCRMPADNINLIPESVSLVEKPYDTSTTNLRVIDNQPSSGEKEDFAVCVKGLDVGKDDLSVRITEWLELLFILGAHKVFLYDLDVHPNVSKVIHYYEEKGRVEVTKLTLPAEQPNIPGLIHMYFKAKIVNKRQNEVIPYNDCLYKNMNRYKYIVLLDIDEIIMPRKVLSWKELMETVVHKGQENKKIPRSSYAIRNVYFLDGMQEPHGYASDIPKYMHMLQHVYRAEHYTKPGQYVKCFHDSDRILILHNHYPFKCIGGWCSPYSVDTEVAHLQHYRSTCVGELKKICKEDFMVNTIKDSAILRFRNDLINRVQNTLIHLGFIQHASHNATPNTDGIM
ncbi:hypothetical protein SK128_006311 [Halocaridina rubra]|uniref:Glycosyltransferase family 92 protein n=1 Tax=Halocaridina rubra TaxID=373956 RepID=A0AAN8ZP91_HALRR